MVPEEAYSSSYLREEPLDKSYDFISQCAAHGYHIRWAGLGAGDGGVQRCGWLAAGLTPTPPPAPPARPPSAAVLPPPSRSSTTMGLGRAAATRWAPRAPHASLSGASVPAAPMSSAATAPAVPRATGASPTAGVSTPVPGVPGVPARQERSGECSGADELALPPPVCESRALHCCPEGPGDRTAVLST